MRLFLFLAIGTQIILFLPESTGNGSTVVRGAWVVIATALLVWQLADYLKHKRHLLYARLGLRPPKANPGYVRALFDDYADTYDQHLTGDLGYRAPQALLALLRPHVEHRRLRIVDLGCGTGLCGPLLAPYADVLVGVDLSERMLTVARARDTYHELVAADAVAYLRARPRHFDLCVAADVLVYVGDLRPVFAATMDALEKGGYFAFTHETPAAGDWVLQSSGRFAHAIGHVRDLATQAGFEIIASRPVTYRLQHGDPVPAAIWLVRKNRGASYSNK